MMLRRIVELSLMSALVATPAFAKVTAGKTPGPKGNTICQFTDAAIKTKVKIGMTVADVKKAFPNCEFMEDEGEGGPFIALKESLQGKNGLSAKYIYTDKKGGKVKSIME